jgi:hypothetical protein
MEIDSIDLHDMFPMYNLSHTILLALL